MSEGMDIETVEAGLAPFGPVRRMRSNRIQVETGTDRARDAIGAALGPLSCDHLIQMSTADTGAVFELIYHLTGPHRMVISIKVAIPRENPVIPSVHDLLPPAGIYERQIHDLFGIVFRGHPNLARIILNEDWPLKEYPMRKDWRPIRGTFYGGIREEVK